MRLFARLCGNLNLPEWNRRVWEIGYRGSPLAKHKIKGKPDYPISGNAILLLHERMNRELQVMKCLATPYLPKDKEQAYIDKYGTANEQKERERIELEQKRMPGKPKRVTATNKVLKTRANIGNLLHEHRTVEGTLRELIERNRWD